MTDVQSGQGLRTPLTPAEARAVGVVLKALATTSRLIILSRLLVAPATVGELVHAVGTTQSAVSHQLSKLRHLGLVLGHRRGHAIVYQLTNPDVVAFVDEAIAWAERLQHENHGRPESTERPIRPPSR